MRSFLLGAPLLILTAALAAGCSGGTPFSMFDSDAETPVKKPKDGCRESAGGSQAEYIGAEPGGIHGFASEAELEAYLADIEAHQPQPNPCERAGGSMDAGAAASGADDSEPPTANEAITNNQEAGVDEGGIVKNVGSHLVVLRKGRLFAVDVAEGKSPALTDSIRVARSAALNDGVWYDEMLVKGDLVYVVGYRYSIPGVNGSYVRGATEIDSFRLVAGKLTRLKSMFLESNDYYSGHNYASRMVDGRLVFYMPHYVGRTSGKLEYPRVLEADDGGKVSVVGPIFGALDVKTSLFKPAYPTFHTVVQCELPETGEFSCHGRSVLGSWWRETYVSPSAVYLWASSHVYRFDFDSLAIGAHAAKNLAYPRDQFSFKETDSKLLVAVTASGGAEVLSLPIAAFDGVGGQTAASTPLGGGGIGENRFVGDVLVASLNNWQSSNQAPTELVSYDSATGGVARAPFGGGVVRLEPLGARRVLVVGGSGTYNSSYLELATFSVDAPQAKLGTVTLDGVSEGEGRSHGFFYKPGTDGGGTFGYGVIAPPGYGAPNGWGNGISNLGFFDVGASGAISQLGIVSAGTDVSQCETSCVDWYGNTRPIFLGSRVFALMGSELAELAIHPGAQKVGSPVELTFTP